MPIWIYFLLCCCVSVGEKLEKSPSKCRKYFRRRHSSSHRKPGGGGEGSTSGVGLPIYYDMIWWACKYICRGSLLLLLLWYLARRVLPTYTYTHAYIKLLPVLYVIKYLCLTNNLRRRYYLDVKVPYQEKNNKIKDVNINNTPAFCILLISWRLGHTNLYFYRIIIWINLLNILCINRI